MASPVASAVLLREGKCPDGQPVGSRGPMEKAEAAETKPPSSRAPNPAPATIRKVPGVYVSYPFCAQKCTYCNFASGVFPPALEQRYLLTLQEEIRSHAWQWQPETVYLGGGTPSSLDPPELASLLTLIPGRPWLEATIEAAPGPLTPEKSRAWASLGIDRVSLGVE